MSLSKLIPLTFLLSMLGFTQIIQAEDFTLVERIGLDDQAWIQVNVLKQLAIANTKVSLGISLTVMTLPKGFNNYLLPKEHDENITHTSYFWALGTWLRSWKIPFEQHLNTLPLELKDSAPANLVKILQTVEATFQGPEMRSGANKYQGDRYSSDAFGYFCINLLYDPAGVTTPGIAREIIKFQSFGTVTAVVVKRGENFVWYVPSAATVMTSYQTRYHSN